MSKNKNKQSLFSILKGYSLSIILFVAIFGMFLWGLGSAEINSRAEEKRILEDSVRRAVVSCYSLEGRYPQDIEYLEKNYGIRIDKNKYAVKYSIFATNIMPDIVVLEIDGKEEIPQ